MYVSTSEAQRLETLWSYGILDTETEAAFDDLTALAAHLCDTPIALLTLIDRDRQWIKSAVGMDLRETSRELSVCTYTIRSPSLLIVPDLHADARFADNPLLNGDPATRFYAGAPLISPSGHALGTICVLDHQPRQLTDEQADALTRLSRQAMAQMELRRSLQALRDSSAELDAARARDAQTGSVLQAALESTADGILVVDRDGRYITYNRTFARIWDLPDHLLARGESRATIRHIMSFVKDPDGFEQRVLAVYAEPESESHDLIEMRDGRVLERYSRPQWLDGEVVGRVWSIRDITERFRAEAELRERERQLAEAQHLARLGHWDWELPANRVHWSDEMCRIYGVEPDPTGFPVDLFIARVHPDDREALQAAVQASLAERRPFEMEHRITLPDGTVRTLHCRGEPITGEDGQPLRMFGTGQDITGRKRTEDELRSARADAERMAARMHALASAAAGLIAADTPTRLATVLRDACRSALTVDHLALLLPEADGNWTRILPAGEPDAAPSPNDTVRPGVSIPLRDESRVLGAIELLRDEGDGYTAADQEVLEAVAALATTALRNLRLAGERRQATEQLRASEASYRAIFDLSSDAIYVHDMESGAILDVNRAACEAHGYPRENFDRLTVTDLSAGVEPYTEERGLANLRRAAAGEPQRVEWLARNSSGSFFWQEVTLRRVTINGTDRILSTARDISERKAAEEALRRAHAELEERVATRTAELADANQTLRFQTALLEAQNHTAIDGILVAHQGRVLSMNRRYAELFNVPEELRAPERCMEMLRWAFTQAADPAAYQARIEQLREDPEAISREEVPLADGRVLDRYSAPLRGADGRHYGRLWVIRDITDRKRTEAELRSAKEEAERANHAKSEFLSRMSHELRTPLNSILGFAQLLSRRNLPADQARSVDYILKAGRHLLNLINEVLDIARIEERRQNFSLEPVHVATSLREALSLVRPLAAQRNCEIQELEQVPEGYVRADRQRLTQVLLNLLSNAVKYNRPGGRAWMTCESAGDRVRIGVHDTGRGIPADRLDELFVPFARLGAENTGVEGTGLGLALSLRLIEAMEGSIRVESELDVGSTFWIELPLAESPLVRLETRRAPVPVAEPNAPNLPARTILYIEDNLANWNLVETIFAPRSEIQLLPALQGRLGLELAREHLPALILLDLHLPDIPGEVVLRELRADPRTREIPVLVISADATRQQIERLRAAGAQSYLTKPLDIDEFLARVDALLNAPAAALA